MKPIGFFIYFFTLFSILFGRQAGIFLENSRKITLLLKAHGNGDVNNRIIGVAQKVLAFFDADIVQIFLKRGTAGFLKQGRKVGGIQLYLGRRFLQSQGLIVVLGHVLDGILNYLAVFS